MDHTCSCDRTKSSWGIIVKDFFAKSIYGSFGLCWEIVRMTSTCCFAIAGFSVFWSFSWKLVADFDSGSRVRMFECYKSLHILYGWIREFHPWMLIHWCWNNINKSHTLDQLPMQQLSVNVNIMLTKGRQTIPH